VPGRPGCGVPVGLELNGPVMKAIGLWLWAIRCIATDYSLLVPALAVDQ
jgi:uncharacterized protein YaaW (UPF0174 family)